MKKLFLFVTVLVLCEGCAPFHALKSGTGRSNAALPPAGDCISVTVDMKTNRRAYSWKLTMNNRNDRARYERFVSKAEKQLFVYRRRIRPDQAFLSTEGCAIRIRRKDGTETSLFIISRNVQIDSNLRVFETRDDIFESVYAMAPDNDADADWQSVRNWLSASNARSQSVVNRNYDMRFNSDCETCE